MSYKRKDPRPLSINEKLDLLERRYWTNEQIMDFTGLKMHAVFKLRKEIKTKNKEAINPYNSGWVDSNIVLKLVFSETREQQLSRLIESFKVKQIMAQNESQTI